MKGWQRIFFYSLSLFYILFLVFEHYDYIAFVKHTTYAHAPVACSVYIVFSCMELVYLAGLTAWYGSTQGSFGRKFMCWWWQIILLSAVITPFLRIYCPYVIAPVIFQEKSVAVANFLSGIPWGLWSLAGLYHLYKYPVFPPKIRRFHQVMAGIYVTVNVFLVLRNLW